ncbi:MAG: hypothetical protein GC129_06245 [Proteobacteria bacterium]|nr:hypothetical protein [Pseudomonadota bacterium]
MRVLVSTLLLTAVAVTFIIAAFAEFNLATFLVANFNDPKTIGGAALVLLLFVLAFGRGVRYQFLLYQEEQAVTALTTWLKAGLTGPDLTQARRLLLEGPLSDQVPNSLLAARLAAEQERLRVVNELHATDPFEGDRFVDEYQNILAAHGNAIENTRILLMCLGLACTAFGVMLALGVGTKVPTTADETQLFNLQLFGHIRLALVVTALAMASVTLLHLLNVKTKAWEEQLVGTLGACVYRVISPVFNSVATARLHRQAAPGLESQATAPAPAPALTNGHLNGKGNGHANGHALAAE